MHRYIYIKNLAYFAVAIVSFHYIYVWWSNNQFKPFKNEVDILFINTGKILFNQSDKLVHLLGISHTEIDNTFYFPKIIDKQEVSSFGNPFLEVSPGCTCLKQWLHWIFLMILFPGPLKHKLWYIPAGVVVLHFVNVLRITILAIVLSHSSGYFHFFHDYLLKALFYGSIFIIWVLWVERVQHIQNQCP